LLDGVGYVLRSWQSQSYQETPCLLLLNRLFVTVFTTAPGPYTELCGSSHSLVKSYYNDVLPQWQQFTFCDPKSSIKHSSHPCILHA
jgi:hypothetical protein